MAARAPRAVAAIVNAGAHRVTPAVIATLRGALGDAAVFVTRSALEARAAVAAIVDGGYQVVCVAGGDGTFVQAASDVHECARAAPPILFALRCGLGNAISDVSGASAPSARGVARDVARARSDEPGRPLRLLRANGRIAYYAGVGLDAVFVESMYAIAKGRWKPLARTLGGATGLTASVLGTLPRLARYRPPHVRVIATAPATPIDPRGAPLGPPCAAGAVLHDGPALVAAAGTIPSYGRGFTAFPLADAVGPGRCHLRTWTIGGGELLRHLPAVWRGRYAPPGGVHDWSASALELTWPEPHVIHIGGDLELATTRLTIEMLPWTVPILRR